MTPSAVTVFSLRWGSNLFSIFLIFTLCFNTFSVFDQVVIIIAAAYVSQEVPLSGTTSFFRIFRTKFVLFVDVNCEFQHFKCHMLLKFSHFLASLSSSSFLIGFQFLQLIFRLQLHLAFTFSSRFFFEIQTFRWNIGKDISQFQLIGLCLLYWWSELAGPNVLAYFWLLVYLITKVQVRPVRGIDFSLQLHKTKEIVLWDG